MRVPVLLALPLLLVALAVALGYGVFTRIRGGPKPRHFSHRQVVSALSNALDLDDSNNHDEFDYFLDQPIDDPYFESIRQECLAVAKGDLKERLPGRDLGPHTEKWLRNKLAELQQNVQVRA
jgi:hypothetical protein